MVLISCKSGAIFQKEQNTKQQIALGYIGLNKDYIFDQGYTNVAIPRLHKPVKVQAVKTTFNKRTYQSFLDAKQAHGQEIDITFSDSLELKPHYVTIKISDQIALIEALNSKPNSSVKTYLESQPEASVITQIAMALKEDDLNTIANAESTFLIEFATKAYGLGLYKNGKLIETIHLSDGVVFNYRVSNLCWKPNSHFRIIISRLVSQDQKCSGKTYSSASRAERRINYYKL